jgi:hypothetical protein
VSRRDRRYHLNVPISYNELLQLASRAAERTGVRIERIDNLHIHISEANMESSNNGRITIGDITGSSVGLILNARDVRSFSSSVTASTELSDGIKQELIAAREALETLSLDQQEKSDAIEHLGKLASELSKPAEQRQSGRIRRYLSGIREIAPPVASVLSIAASLTKLTQP